MTRGPAASNGGGSWFSDFITDLTTALTPCGTGGGGCFQVDDWEPLEVGDLVQAPNEQFGEVIKVDPSRQLLPFCVRTRDGNINWYAEGRLTRLQLRGQQQQRLRRELAEAARDDGKEVGGNEQPDLDVFAEQEAAIIEDDKDGHNSLRSAATIAATDRDDLEAAELTRLTVVFEPYKKVGIDADWQSGLVNFVDEAHQAHRLGVRVGMYLVAVASKPYTVDRYKAKAVGASYFEVTFAQASYSGRQNNSRARRAIRSGGSATAHKASKRWSTAQASPRKRNYHDADASQVSSSIASAAQALQTGSGPTSISQRPPVSAPQADQQQVATDDAFADWDDIEFISATPAAAADSSSAQVGSGSQKPSGDEWDSFPSAQQWQCDYETVREGTPAADAQNDWADFAAAPTNDAPAVTSAPATVTNNITRAPATGKSGPTVDDALEDVLMATSSPPATAAASANSMFDAMDFDNFQAAPPSASLQAAPPVATALNYSQVPAATIDSWQLHQSTPISLEEPATTVPTSAAESGSDGGAGLLNSVPIVPTLESTASEPTPNSAASDSFAGQCAPANAIASDSFAGQCAPANATASDSFAGQCAPANATASDSFAGQCAPAAAAEDDIWAVAAAEQVVMQAGSQDAQASAAIVTSSDTAVVDLIGSDIVDSEPAFRSGGASASTAAASPFDAFDDLLTAPAAAPAVDVSSTGVHESSNQLPALIASQSDSAKNSSPELAIDFSDSSTVPAVASAATSDAPVTAAATVPAKPREDDPFAGLGF